MDLSLLTPDEINRLRLLIAPAASQVANPNPAAAVAASQPVQHTIPNAFGQLTAPHLPQPSQSLAPVPLTIAPTPVQAQAAPTPPITQIYTGNRIPGIPQPAAPAYPPTPSNQPAPPAYAAHPAPSGYPPPSLAHPAPGGFQPFLGAAGLGLNLATGHANQARLASSLSHSSQNSLPIRGSRAGTSARARGSGGRGTGRRGNASRPPSLNAEEPAPSRESCLVQNSPIPTILITVVVLPPLVRIISLLSVRLLTGCFPSSKMTKNLFHTVFFAHRSTHTFQKMGSSFTTVFPRPFGLSTS